MPAAAGSPDRSRRQSCCDGTFDDCIDSIVVERSGDVVTGTSLLENRGILEFLAMFKIILESSITCGLTCALASISDGVQKRMADLVVPAGEKKFRERIHEPVVAFLEENRPALAQFGAPLLLIAAGVPHQIFWVYGNTRTVKLLVGVHGFRGWKVWKHLLRFASSGLITVAIAQAFATAPFRISAAVKDLRRGIHDFRCQQPMLHTQISAIHAVMDETDFGIAVGDSLVITGSLIVKTAITVGSMFGMIMSLVDNVMGYESATRDSMTSQSDQLSAIEGRLEKLTDPMRPKELQALRESIESSISRIKALCGSQAAAGGTVSHKR
ncbi:unnamed protein product [Prorocentrum cordatum]|uniref:Uncharacterized protein n=1 Tax=Prorocentrum cordatum TaxID=2364126 RepID=A0ABN9YBW3_9DINO|nr:unnamed protein product [Polarella glacialis]